MHSSMYAGLRTNLPREVMGFGHYPFTTTFPGSADPRQFPTHDEVSLSGNGGRGFAAQPLGCCGPNFVLLTLRKIFHNR